MISRINVTSRFIYIRKLKYFSLYEQTKILLCIKEGDTDSITQYR